MPCRFASSGTVATSRSASRAILALKVASNFLRDLVISILHRLRQSRTLHTLTFGPISGVHFSLQQSGQSKSKDNSRSNSAFLYPAQAGGRLGPLHARQRVGIETDHEAQVFGQGLTFFHLENWYSAPAISRVALKLMGLYWRARQK